MQLLLTSSLRHQQQQHICIESWHVTVVHHQQYKLSKRDASLDSMFKQIEPNEDEDVPKDMQDFMQELGVTDPR